MRYTKPRRKRDTKTATIKGTHSTDSDIFYRECYGNDNFIPKQAHGS